MRRSVSKARAILATLGVGLVAVVLGASVPTQAGQQQAPSRPGEDQAGFQTFVRDLTKELANKMEGRYVVAAVGDILWQEPAGQMLDPAIKKILQEADTTIGNKEGYVLEARNWLAGHGGNWAPKELAKDLADLGFDVLAPGEGNGGAEGMASAAKWYGEVGIQIAGQGPNLSTARMPVFQQLAKGRVATVGAFPVPDRFAGSRGPSATDRTGNSGRETWGMNPLRLTVWNVVTPEMLEQIKAMKATIMAKRYEPDVARPAPLARTRIRPTESRSSQTGATWRVQNLDSSTLR